MTDLEWIEHTIRNWPLVACLTAGMAGTFANWIKRYLKSETALGPFAFLMVHFRAVLGSYICLLAVIAPMVSAGLEADFKSLGLFYLAGYKLNSIFTPTDALEDDKKPSPPLRSGL